MKLIYEPRGKAREYSPLALNIYKGCGHKCSYCYVPDVIRISRNEFDNKVNPRNEIDNYLEKEIKKYSYSKKQVFMSFTTDPYNPYEEKYKLTYKALTYFYYYKIPVCILTKSGKKCLRDLELFKKFGKHIKVGASLTFDNDKQTKITEAGTAMPSERLETLKILKNNNVPNWVSFEPIMNFEQTLNLLNQCIDYVDEFQFGKLSGDNRKLDWDLFLTEILPILRNRKKKFYIKETLRNSAKNIYLNPHETDMDLLQAEPF